MAQSPVIYALVAKRSEIGGIISDLEERTRQARADLAHIDATLLLFDPDAIPQQIRDKRPAKGRSGLFANGEISRRGRAALRDAVEPISAESVVRQAITDKGLDPEDKPMRQAMIRSFLWALHRMQTAGTVQRLGKGLGARWALGPPQVWGSGGNRLRMRTCIVGWVEFLSVAGTKRAIVDPAANLEKEISPLSRPAHLLRFIHSAVHQEIGRPLGDRSPNPQPGTVAFGVIDHPVTLASEIVIQRVQGGPQLSRGCDRLSLALFALKMMHHRTNAIDAGCASLKLCHSTTAMVQPLQLLLDDHRLRRHPRRIIGRAGRWLLLEVLEPHADVEPVENWQLGDAGISEECAAVPEHPVGEGGQHRAHLGSSDSVEALADQDFDVCIGFGNGFRKPAARQVLPFRRCRPALPNAARPPHNCG